MARSKRIVSHFFSFNYSYLLDQSSLKNREKKDTLSPSVPDIGTINKGEDRSCSWASRKLRPHHLLFRAALCVGGSATTARLASGILLWGRSTLGIWIRISLVLSRATVSRDLLCARGFTGGF